MKKTVQKQYIDSLLKLESAIIQGDVDKLKELNDSKINFQKYLKNERNPFRKTNAVILACCEKQVRVLEYLLSDESKIIEKLSDIENGKILPTDEDETHHNAFYYAIRSGDSNMVQMLIARCQGIFRNEELDEILSSAYEELKLNNVVLSNEIKCFIEKQLIDYRFNAASSKQRNDVNDSMEVIKERVAIIVENFESVSKNYPTTEEIDEECLQKMKFIVQNINVLKQKLRSTYDRLPWEEIEFCLIMFISTHKNQNINLFYYSSLENHKILNHLGNFVKKLEAEMKNLNEYKYSTEKLSAPIKTKRSTIVGNLIRNSPEFESLYEDYQHIRDLCSLEKIKETLKLTLDADVSERKGKLVITRIIQILGEYMKNTLESPKLSDATNELLLVSLPKNTRKLVLTVRDSVSHIDSLFKRTQIENNKENAFFSRISNDLKGIGSVVDNILQARKAHIFTSFINKLQNAISYSSYDEYEKLKKIFQNSSETEFFRDKFNNLVYNQIKALVDECNKLIPDQTEYEKQLFQQIYNDIQSMEECMMDNNNRYEIINDILTSDENLLNNRWFMDVQLEKIILEKNQSSESFDVKQIGQHLLNICKSASARSRQHDNDIAKIAFHVLGMSADPDVKWIQDLDYKLNEKELSRSSAADTNTFTKEMCRKELSMKLSELQCILPEYRPGTVQYFKYFKAYQEDKQTQAAVEMLLLDIISISAVLKINLGMDYLFVDSVCPVLVGKCLRNHLAHYNELVPLLLDDSDRVIFLNAIKLISEKFIENKSRHTLSIRENISSLKMKHENCLETLNKKRQMFVACENGNIDALKINFLKGADVNSRSSKGHGVMYFASKGNSIAVLQFLINLNQNLSLGLNELEVAVANGKRKIVEFIVEKIGVIADDINENKEFLLHIAAKKGHKDVVEVLIKNKYDPRKYNIEGMPIHYAAKYNHKNVVEFLLRCGNTIDDRNRTGLTLLHIAANCGYYELVEYLLELKSDVNAKSYNIGLTPLQLAAQHGHLEVIKLLILKGADVNGRDIKGISPLHYATERNQANVVSFLLEHGANIEASAIMTKWTSLHIACEKGFKDLVELLIEKGAEGNVRTSHGTTPMHLAAEHKHGDIFTILLEYGLDIHAKTKHQDTILHYAAESGQKEIADKLLRFKIEINAKNVKGVTPLHLAAFNGHVDIVDLLINNGAVVNSKSKNGDTPLHLAVVKNHKKVIKKLLNENAKVDATNMDGVTPLYLAIMQGDIEAITLLLEHGAEATYDPGDKNSLTLLKTAIVKGDQDIVKLVVSKFRRHFGNSDLWSNAMESAVQFEHTKIVEFLIATAVDFNFSGNGPKLLEKAVAKNNKEIVEVLIEKGALASRHLADKLLCVAVKFGHADMVDILLKHGASADENCENGTPLLVEAAKLGYIKMFKSLIEKCKNVNAASDRGITALHNAVIKGHKEVVEMLLNKGANVNVKCDDGTPLHMAAAYNDNSSIAELLLTRGADENIKNNKKLNALQLAVGNNNLVVVKTLLSGSKIKHTNTQGTADGLTLLHFAAPSGNIDLIRYLIDQGANIDEKDNYDYKPIHVAASQGKTEIVKFFLNKGSCVNELGYKKQTLLHIAIRINNIEMLKYLVSKNANINAQTTDGETPLHFCVIYGCKEIARVLLNNGAIYNLVDRHNLQPIERGSSTKEQNDVVALLRCAENLLKGVKRNDVAEVMKCFKEEGISNVKDVNENTPLHFAAWKGYSQIVEILLKFKANSNFSTKDGSTPLHYAAKFSHIKVVKILLSNGAMYNPINNAKSTPLDLAKEDLIIKLLETVDELFKGIQGNERVLSEIEKIEDDEMMKVILNARNRNNKSLLMVAMLRGFPKIEKLKQISFRGMYSHLAIADELYVQGEFGGALSIYQNVLENLRTSLGPNYFGLLEIKARIAEVLLRKSNYDEALAMFTEISDLQTEFLGPEFIDTLNTRSSIALVLRGQEKYTEALAIFNDIYYKQRKFLKSNSDEIINTKTNMANVLLDLERYEEALKLNYETYAVLKTKYGEKHLRTISIRHNIGAVLSEMEQYEKSIEIFEETYKIMAQLLGPFHSDTLMLLHNLAGVYMKIGKYKDAITLLEQIFDIQKKTVGYNHRDTMKTQLNIGRALLKQGTYNEALRTLEEYLRNAKPILGSSHTEIIYACALINKLKSFLKVTDYNDMFAQARDVQRNLNIAASSGEEQTVIDLINSGAYVNDVNQDGRNALYYAVYHGKIKIVKLLLRNSANIFQITKKGNTLFHTAASKGYEEIVEVLLQYAEREKYVRVIEIINSRTLKSGATPLHVAAKSGSYGIVKSLLLRGAAFDIVNNEGFIPFKVSQNQDIIRLLTFVQDIFKHAISGAAKRVMEKLKTGHSDHVKAALKARNVQNVTLLQAVSKNCDRNTALHLVNILKNEK